MKYKNNFIGIILAGIIGSTCSFVNAEIIISEPDLNIAGSEIYKDFYEISIPSGMITVPNFETSDTKLLTNGKSTIVAYRIPAYCFFYNSSDSTVTNEMLKTFINDKYSVETTIKTIPDSKNLKKTITYIQFCDEYLLNKSIAQEICNDLNEYEITDNLYFRDYYYDTVKAEFSNTYPLELTDEILNIISENEINASVQETGYDDGLCVVYIMNETVSIESLIDLYSKIYEKTGHGPNTAFMASVSESGSPEIQVLHAENYELGDVDGNGIIDLTDLSELSLSLVGDNELTESQQKAADVDGSGDIKLADLATLKQYLSKQIESLGILSEEGEQSETPQPVPTVTPLPSIPDKGARPEVWPVNREENNPFDIATLRGNTYSKRCVFSFEESQIEEKSVLPFFYEDVETSSGGVAVAKVVKDISSEEMFLLKCGTEEGKYFVFLNNSLSGERTKEIYEELGITDYTNPIDADIPETPQPVPTVTPFK